MVRSMPTAALAAWIVMVPALAATPAPAQDTPAPIEAEPPADATSTAVPLRPVDQRKTVAVRINGAGPFRFIVDSGATRTVVSRRLAILLGLPSAGIATLHSVGGGTSFSMLQTMNEAHKVARLGGHHLTATRMFWLATAGAAEALDLADKVGTLAPKSEADFVVLDPQATPLLARRTGRTESLEELLFAFALLGDDRAIFETYAAGKRVHKRDEARQRAVRKAKTAA